MVWNRETWVDDDGSLTVGTPFTAANMNNIEEGLAELEAERKERKLAIDGSASTTTEGKTATVEYTPVSRRIQGVLVMIAQDYSTVLAQGSPEVKVGETNVATADLIGTFETASRGSIKVYFQSSAHLWQKNSSKVLKVNIAEMANSVKKRVTAVFLNGPGPLRASMKLPSSSFAETKAANFESAVEEAGNENILIGVAQTSKKPTLSGTGGESLLQAEMATNIWLSVIANQERFVRGLSITKPKLTLTTSENSSFATFSIGVAPVHDWGQVTSVSGLPVGAGIGDTCHYLADATNNVTWDFEYDFRNETYPWRKTGGAAIRKSAEGKLATSSATAQTTSAPSVNAPLAMEFKALYGAMATRLEANGVQEFRTPLFVNSVESDLDATTKTNPTGAIGYSIFDGMTIQRTSNPLTVEKGKAIQTRYASQGSITVAFYSLFVEVDPIRVG